MTNRKVLIITPTEIKNDSVIEENADNKILKESILLCQDLYLSEILGKTLYDRVIESIYDFSLSATPIAADIVALIPYIKKYLLYSVVRDFTINNHYKLSNKGTFVLSDSNATPATIKELEYRMSSCDRGISGYKNLLIEYLTDNDLIVDCNTDVDFFNNGIYTDFDNE